jgi:hypothetical protein
MILLYKNLVGVGMEFSLKGMCKCDLVFYCGLEPANIDAGNNFKSHPPSPLPAPHSFRDLTVLQISPVMWAKSHCKQMAGTARVVSALISLCE